MKKTMYLTQGAIIAAAYFVLCMMVAPIAWGPIQFRVSEALMVLPVLTSAAVPGLFVGCLLFNLLNPANLGPIDIIFGSLATLIAAWVVYEMGRRMKPALADLSVKHAKFWLIPLPSVIANGLIVGGYLLFLLPDTDVTVGAVLMNMLSIAVCEAVVVYIIGMILLMVLKRSRAVMKLCGQPVSAATTTPVHQI